MILDPCLQKCPTKLWPSIVSLIQDREDYLCQEKIAYFYDERAQITYYLAKADMRVTMVVIFKGKKNERDSHVVTFLQGKSTVTKQMSFMCEL